MQLKGLQNLQLMNIICPNRRGVVLLTYHCTRSSAKLDQVSTGNIGHDSRTKLRTFSYSCAHLHLNPINFGARIIPTFVPQLVRHLVSLELQKGTGKKQIPSNSLGVHTHWNSKVGIRPLCGKRSFGALHVG